MLFKSKKMSALLLTLLPFSLVSGCSSNAYDVKSPNKNAQSSANPYLDNVNSVETIRNYALNTTTPSQRQQIKALLEADFQRQIDEGYTNVRIYKEKIYTISDIMIINERGDKGIFFITHLMQHNDDGIVKMYTGQKMPHKNSWEFTDGGIPQYYYAFKEVDVNAPPFTERMLIDRTLEDLANDGLVNSRGAISQDYLNNHWF